MPATIHTSTRIVISTVRDALRSGGNGEPGRTVINGGPLLLRGSDDLPNHELAQVVFGSGRGRESEQSAISWHSAALARNCAFMSLLHGSDHDR
jgi:hypothetical protein